MCDAKLIAMQMSSYSVWIPLAWDLGLSRWYPWKHEPGRPYHAKPPTLSFKILLTNPSTRYLVLGFRWRAGPSSRRPSLPSRLGTQLRRGDREPKAKQRQHLKQALSRRLTTSALRQRPSQRRHRQARELVPRSFLFSPSFCPSMLGVTVCRA